MSSADPAQRRRARRTRPQKRVRDTAPGEDVIFKVEEKKRSAHQLLGIRPDASALQVVQAYQRAQHAAQTDQQRRDLVEAFRKLGARPIRTRCPFGHEIGLYAIDGEIHSAYCASCYEEGLSASHRYIGWAQCLEVRRYAGPEMDVEKLPYGIEPRPQSDVEIRYKTPQGEKTVIFTMDAKAKLRLHPSDFFTLLYRDQLAWRLLNHTVAQTFTVDPHHAHRSQLDERLQQARLRAELEREQLGSGLYGQGGAL